jgi:hypothetical protein
MIELSELIAKSVAWFKSLTPEEQEAHLREQRESWVRGEMAIGLDRDEAAWREANMPPTETHE